MGIVDIIVPDIGDFEDVPIIEILVRPGDAVAKEDSLITLESEKATMDVPSPQAGVVTELRVRAGDKVSKGTLILRLDTEAEATKIPAGAPPEAPADPQESGAASRPTAFPSPLAASPKASAVVAGTFKIAHASPSVRRFARELGVDVGRVAGSAPKGRILKEDVQAFVKAALAKAAGAGFAISPMPAVDFAKFGPVSLQALSRIKKLAGANLHRNWVSIPHVTQFDEADITELEAFRKDQAGEAQRRGFKLTMLAFLVKAAVVALKKFPDLNASLDAGGENLVLKNYYHIGVAVDTSEGLVVPVIRDADRKGVYDLAKELAEISARAREKKLSPTEMQGGSFTISSLGGIGGTFFTPIINAPEVAILGVSRSVMKPVFQNNQFSPRLMLPVALSYDHRVIDGAEGARFTAYLCQELSDIRRLLL